MNGIERAKRLLVEGRLLDACASLDGVRRRATETQNVEQLEEVISLARIATKGSAALTFRSFEDVERSARNDLQHVLLRNRRER